MKKKLLILFGVIFVCIFVGVALFLCAIIVGYTPILKERSDFNPEEIQIIEEELSFRLGDDAKIVNARFTHTKDTDIYLWIEGIKDKNDFVKRNGLTFQHAGEYNSQLYLGIDTDEAEYREAEYYTSLGYEVQWYLYEDGNTWNAFVDGSHAGQTYKLFDRVKNQISPRRWFFLR